MSVKIKKINGIELDYVSGSFINFMKLLNKDKDLQKKDIENTKRMLTHIETKLKGYFTFSTLFNAYQEEKGGQTLQENDGLGHDKIYADSGGLQVVSTGKVINDEVKKKVYTTQAKYSDFAMTFDEMPLKLVESIATDSAIGDAGRVYIKELIPITAKQSAEHIQTQIDLFKELESSTKILPILHGYSADTFIEYAVNLLNSLEGIDDKIQGIAIASLNGHSDNKVGIMKMFDFIPKILNTSKINNEYLQHIHLLGVALPQRLIPVLMMIKKGMLPIKKLSFDSTAIMRGMIFGKAYKNADEYKNPRNYKRGISLKKYNNKQFPNIAQLYQNIHNLFKDFEGYEFESWEDLAKHSPNNGVSLTPSKQFEKFGMEYERKFLAQGRYAVLYNNWAYLNTLEAYLDDKLTVQDIFGNNESISQIFNSFEEAKTLEEFDELCDWFYNSASKGRTDLRINSCETLKEFEEKYLKKQPCLHDALGIEKDLTIVNEEFRKPWLKTSLQKLNDVEYSDDDNPVNALF